MDTKERKLINNLYSRLERVMASKEWGRTIPDMFKMELDGERRHRRGWEGQYKMTPTEAAKYFTVKHVFDGLTSDLQVKDITHIRLECYYGQAVAQNYRAEIVNEFSQAEIVGFLALDYAEMVK